MLTFLVLVASLEAPLVIRNLEVEHVPNRHNAVVSATGQLFLLDVFSGLVYRYGPDGTAYGQLGGKGSGPGEYNKVYRLFAQGERVFLWDRMGGKVLVYGPDGEFLQSVREAGTFDLLPASGSWICGSWLVEQDPKEPIRVFLAGRDLAPESVLLSWHREGTASLGKVVQRDTPESRISFPFNPAPDNPLMAFAPGTGKLYVYQPGKILRIHVLDLATGEQVGVIRRKVKRIPFDEAWGMERMKKVQEQSKASGGNIQLVPDFPEYYPLVGLLLVSAEGPLVMGHWRAAGKPYAMIAVDETGADAPLSYDPTKEYQILAIQNQRAWLGVNLGEDQPGVIVVGDDAIAAAFSQFDSSNAN